MNVVERSKPAMARNIRRLGHIDLPGAGQVYVAGKYAYVGHIPNKNHLGTSIVDISDPANPRVVSQITLDDPNSHSHKARVIGDIMIVNSERNMTAIGRRADELPRVREGTDRRARARADACRDRDLARRRAVRHGRDRGRGEARLPKGGFKIYDVSNPAKPKEIVHHKTHGIGVHRFDMDASYAYISTEMAGLYRQHPRHLRHPQSGEAGGSVALVDARAAHRRRREADLARPPAPAAPRAALRRRAVGGLLARRRAHRRRVRHPKPKTIGAYNYHPPFPEPSHTFMPVPKPIDGKRIAVAIDEEDHAHSADEERARRGRPHAAS